MLPDRLAPRLARMNPWPACPFASAVPPGVEVKRGVGEDAGLGVLFLAGKPPRYVGFRLEGFDAKKNLAILLNRILP